MKHLKTIGKWPTDFARLELELNRSMYPSSTRDSDIDDESDEDDDLFVNNNRMLVCDESSDEEAPLN